MQTSRILRIAARSSLIILATLTAGAPQAVAQSEGTPAAAPPPTLGIGDPAPPLKTAGWSTGTALEGMQPGQVYVVEFWATWCGPCRVSMPHLSQLQQSYGEKATFVGVTREDPETVEKFLEQEQSPGKTWREVVQYRLALDDAGFMNTAYMRAANQNGIPTAFIVGRDQRIEWIGHPMRMDEPLAKVVANEWDRDAAIVEFRKEQAANQLTSELNTLVRTKDWDAALSKLDQAVELGIDPARVLSLRIAVLRLAERFEQVAQLEAGYVESVWEQASPLNEYAWRQCLLRGERNLPLALKAAQRAAELSEEQDASILDTLARVYFEQGELAEAISWQKKAVAVDKGATAEINAALKRYEAALAAEQASATGDQK